MCTELSDKSLKVVSVRCMTSDEKHCIQILKSTSLNLIK